MTLEEKAEIVVTPQLDPRVLGDSRDQGGRRHPRFRDAVSVCESAGSMASGRLFECFDLIWPCMAALMGWTWSLYFAQQMNPSIVGSSLRALGSFPVDLEGFSAQLDGRRPPSAHSLRLR